MSNKNNIPVLAVTMGDPAGIGPEIAAKTFANTDVYSICKPVLIGNRQIMAKAIKLVGVDLKINSIKDIAEAKFEPGTMDLYHLEAEHVADIKFGVVSAVAGDLAFRAVKKAIDLALTKEVDGTVTGPIHKGAINAAGHHFSGHTEIYAHYTNTAKYAMLLAEEDLRVIHVSTHVSLREACDRVKKDRITEVIQLLDDSLKKLGITQPKIGVAGLNPHSSDNGLFGWEEKEEIEPALEYAKSIGIDAVGPVPPDTLFAMAKGGKFDGCVAMYHDQGHIPFKVVGFNWDKEKNVMKSVKGVNITLGLPIIRTSVDHGTAFEVAGKGVASPDALHLAIEYATKLYQSET
ncbi:4-hydroxythreonine-4-phosphate dehydrogenase PdxA [Saccharicrinis sp. FJH62]|uniref:4-hydroxythreonine-4-phosphate dehydrogenase PdxA n=1 Tax=Saccharicrinis sp. FJH62 TaxID=3344657 RepID=UPI0035D4BFC7